MCSFNSYYLLSILFSSLWAFRSKILTSKNALCPRHRKPLALISDCTSNDEFLPINCSSSVRGCNIVSTLTSFVSSCNISAILSRNSLYLKVTNPPFCTITHARLCNILNNDSDLQVVLVEVVLYCRYTPS